MKWDQLLSTSRIRESKSNNSYDYRSEFEKDYHRIISSASFRRLQDKTQVFPLEKSDFVRTRLTHSLEVSSIAKSLGQSIYNRLVELNKNDNLSLNQATEISDILLCAGLIHDIGNPPFGHFGETIIQEWFKKNKQVIEFDGQTLENCLDEQMIGDLCNFEGNAQALRLVSKHGMNLTKAIMNTIIKYPVSSLEINKDSGNIKDKKMGYFSSEEAMFKSIIEETGVQEYRHPLTFILEAADDIAYRTADIVDGFKKGLITYEQLLDEIRNNSYSNFSNDNRYKYCDTALNDLEELYTYANKNNINNPELYAIHNWISKLQGLLIGAATFTFTWNYRDIMNGNYSKDLFEDSYAHFLVKILGEIAVKYIFNSKGILKLEIAASTIIEFLLDKFVHAVLYYDTKEKLSSIDKKLISLISDNYISVYKEFSSGKTEQEKLYLRLILVTDFISGMTDNYAKTLYQELNGIY